MIFFNNVHSMFVTMAPTGSSYRSVERKIQDSPTNATNFLNHFKISVMKVW